MPQPKLSLVSHEEGAPAVGNDLDSAFRAYSSFVATLAFRVLGRKDEVEDVVHDVFLAAHRKLPADPSEARAWLTVVTVRIARRRLRGRRFHQWIGLDEVADDAEHVDPGASPHDQALLAVAFRALDRVPLEERLAWSLRHLHGEPLEAVAKACECSLATAKRRIAFAQTRLREAMGDD